MCVPVLDDRLLITVEDMREIRHLRKYVDEMLEAWTTKSKQAAYETGIRLLNEIQKDFEYLKRQETAIQALGSFLREDPEVDADAAPAVPEPETPESHADKIQAVERPRMIIQAANEVWAEQQDPWGGPETDLIKTQDVYASLRKKGLDLGVSQPLAVIGTVLASADGYTKIARNTFEYTPPPASRRGN